MVLSDLAVSMESETLQEDRTHDTFVRRLNLVHIFMASLELRLGLLKLGEGIREVVQFLVATLFLNVITKQEKRKSNTHILQLFSDFRELSDIKVGYVHGLLLRHGSLRIVGATLFGIRSRDQRSESAALSETGHDVTDFAL